MKTTGLDAVLLALRGDSGLTGAEKGDAGNNPAFTAAFDAAARSAAQQKAPQRDAGSTRRPDSPEADTGKALPGSGSDMPITAGVATPNEVASEASEVANGLVTQPLDQALSSSPFVKDALERAASSAAPSGVTASAPLEQALSSPPFVKDGLERAAASAAPSDVKESVPLEQSLSSSPFVKDGLERAAASAIPSNVKASALAQPLPSAAPASGIGGAGNTAGDFATKVTEVSGHQTNTAVSAGDSSAVNSKNNAAHPRDNSAFASAVRTVATEARGLGGAESRVAPAGSAAVDAATAEPARARALQEGSTPQLAPTTRPNEPAVAKPSDVGSASRGAIPDQANETGRTAAAMASRLQSAVEGSKPPGLDVASSVRQPGVNTPTASVVPTPTPPGAESPSRNDATADTLLRQTPIKATELPLAAAKTKPAVEGQDNAGRFEGPGTRSTQTAAPLSAAAAGGDSVEPQRAPVSMPSSLQRPPLLQPASGADGMTARGEVQVEQATMARATGQPGLGEAMDHRQALSDRRAAGQPRVTAETKPVSPPSGISPSESATALKTTFNALSNEVSRAPAEQQPVGLKQDVGAASPDPVSRGAEGAASTLVGNSAMPARAAETVSQPLPTQLPDIKQAPDSPEFADEVLARVRMIQGRNGTEARLNLHPAELGRLQIAITSEGDATRVAFVVENAQAKEVLEQAMPRLREFLQQAGLQLTDSSVAQQGTRDGGGYGANDPSKGSHAAPSTDTDGEEGPRANPGSDPTRIVDAYA